MIFLGLMSGSFVWGFGHLANIVDREPRLSLFGFSLPWLAVVLLYEASILFFLFLATCRKMESERLHAFSKPQAVAAMSTLGTLLAGGVWNLTDFEAIALVVLYLLVIIGILLTVTVTPTQAEYYKGLWRAAKQGRPAFRSGMTCRPTGPSSWSFVPSSWSRRPSPGNSLAVPAPVFPAP